jgi:hypothetical protein
MTAMLVALPACAVAQTAPPVPVPVPVPPAGNLPADFYPRSPCTKPDLSMIGRKPGDARDVQAVEAYNKQVQAYNQAAPAFNACIQAYADRANVDIGRIRAAVQDANH